MAEVVRKKVEGYKSGKQLTGHSLGYLACLVKILFQLDILSRIGPRRGLEGMGRTSSISAVSSSIDAVVSKVANGNSITRNQLTLSKFSTFSTVVIDCNPRERLERYMRTHPQSSSHPPTSSNCGVNDDARGLASQATSGSWTIKAPGFSYSTVLDRQAGDGSNTVVATMIGRWQHVFKSAFWPSESGGRRSSGTTAVPFCPIGYNAMIGWGRESGPGHKDAKDTIQS